MKLDQPCCVELVTCAIKLSLRLFCIQQDQPGACWKAVHAEELVDGDVVWRLPLAMCEHVCLLPCVL